MTLPAAIERIADADQAVLGLGMSRCPASVALAASLESVAAARPSTPVVMAMLDSPDDWALRETELWPRAIRVSRASIPVVAVLHDGSARALRHGAAPASLLDRWIAESLGPPETALPEGPTAAELAVLERTGERRRLHSDVKGRREPGL